MRWFTRFYGANPLHLLALLGCFALAAYVSVLLWTEPSLPHMVLWFVGAIVAHDLVLFPVYALGDLALTVSRRFPVSPVNYVRTPLLGAGLLFLLFFPGIVQQGTSTYLQATGQTQQPFLHRWVLLTVAMFVISAVLYVVRVGCAIWRAHRRRAREQVRD